MAVFRKFLSATKNKIKPSTIKVDSGGGGGGGANSRNNSSGNNIGSVDEEFENRKLEWQEELDQMSDFLVLKSTEEQREEGVENPVDTAFIDDKDGMPVLKACFDVQHFKPDEVQLSVEDGILTVFAQCLEEKDVAVFKKTMIRRLEIPKYVDHKMMHCVLSQDQKILTIDMPFHLPPQKRPIGPTVVPVLSDEGGRRKIRLVFSVGTDFTQDDVVVSLDRNKPQCLTVDASYEAEIGLYGSQVTRRQFRKRFRLPDFVNVDTVEHSLSDDGDLFVDIFLKDDPGFKFKVTTEKFMEKSDVHDEYPINTNTFDGNRNDGPAGKTSNDTNTPNNIEAFKTEEDDNDDNDDEEEDSGGGDVRSEGDGGASGDVSLGKSDEGSGFVRNVSCVDSNISELVMKDKSESKTNGKTENNSEDDDNSDGDVNDEHEDKTSRELYLTEL